jgi:hypothetical protein
MPQRQLPDRRQQEAVADLILVDVVDADQCWVTGLLQVENLRERGCRVDHRYRPNCDLQRALALLRLGTRQSAAVRPFCCRGNRHAADRVEGGVLVPVQRGERKIRLVVAVGDYAELL